MSPIPETSVGPKDALVINDVIRTAKSLFEKFGLKKTTMEDIAATMGKGKSSLYYYFNSKYDIFEAVVETEIQSHLNNAYKAMEKAESARAQLKCYFNVQACKIAKQGNLSQVIKNDLMENMDLVMRIRKKHEINQVSLVKEILAGGVKSGEFKKIKSADIDLLAYLFVGTSNGISAPMCADQHFVDTDTRVNTIIDALVDGIGK